MPPSDNQGLVSYLKEIGAIKTPAIERAFLRIDRAEFVRAELKSQAYLDIPLPIGGGQTISQPQTVALMLEWLSPQPGDKVLDIGYGSGWTTALLAEIVGLSAGASLASRKTGLVIGIERLPELCRFGFENIKKFFPFVQRLTAPSIHQLTQPLVLWCGDGKAGFAPAAPFDRILAGASASTVPLPWKKQLKVGGRLVAPVKDSLLILEKKSATDFEEKYIPGFLFVPLV